MKKTLLLLLATCLTSLLQAQSGSVSGQITNEEGTPLSEVTVRLDDRFTITGKDGLYQLKEVENGAHTISISYLGYESLSIEFEIVNNEEKKVDLRLRETVTDLPEVVISSVSMTGGQRNLRNLPGSAAYISPKQLQMFQYSDITRTLRSLPGINIQEEDGFGMRPNIGMRGTGVDRSGKITLMEDGILMAPAPYAAPEAYYFPTFGRMQAVEVLKGSSQIQYGPYTTGGALNLISTQIPDHLTTNLLMSGSGYGGKQLHAWMGDTYERFAFLAETFRISSDGFKELDNGGPTGFEKQDYLIKLRLQSAADARYLQSLTLKAGLTEEVSDETYTGLTYQDYLTAPFRRYAGSQLDKMTTRHEQLSLRYSMVLSPSLQWEVTAYRNDFHRNWYKLDKVTDSLGTAVSISSLLADPDSYTGQYEIITGGNTTGIGALQVKANNRTYYSQGAEAVLHYSHNGVNWNQHIQAGIRVHEDQIDRYQWVDLYGMDQGIMELQMTGTAGSESNRLVTADALAAYLQYTLRRGQWTLTPGLRLEDITKTEKNYGTLDPERTGADLEVSSNNTSTLIPGLLAEYRMSDQWYLYTGVHRGFAPAGVDTGSLPESSVNTELGARYWSRHAQATAVIFYNDYSNLLGVDMTSTGGLGTGQTFNGGAATVYGLECSLGADLLPATSNWQLPVQIAYTFTKGYFDSSFGSDLEEWEEVEAGDELPYLAPQQLYLQLSAIRDRWSVHSGTRYTADMRAVAGQGAIPTEELVPAHVVSDLSVHYTFAPGASAWAGVNNLTNNTYIASIRPAGWRPGMPRTFTIGVRTLLTR